MAFAVLYAFGDRGEREAAFDFDGELFSGVGVGAAVPLASAFSNALL